MELHPAIGLVKYHFLEGEIGHMIKKGQKLKIILGLSISSLLSNNMHDMLCLYWADGL